MTIFKAIDRCPSGQHKASGLCWCKRIADDIRHGAIYDLANKHHQELNAMIEERLTVRWPDRPSDPARTASNAEERTTVEQQARLDAALRHVREARMDLLTATCQAHYRKAGFVLDAAIAELTILKEQLVEE